MILFTNSLSYLLQVQRKRTVKSPQEKLAKAPPATFPSNIGQEGTSIIETQRLETAKRDILESLNITSKGVTGGSRVEPAFDGGEELTKRVEESLQNVRETQETVNRLSNILNAVSAASGDVPADVVSETVPVNETSLEEPLCVGDAIVHAVLTGGVNEPPAVNEEYTESFQPVDSVMPSSDVITIAGEIVGTTTNVEHQLSSKDTPLGEQSSGVTEASTISVPFSIHDDVTGTADQSYAFPPAVTPSKKSKRQLAVSFTSSNN